MNIIEVKGQLSEEDKAKYSEEAYNIVFNANLNITFIWKKAQKGNDMDG